MKSVQFSPKGALLKRILDLTISGTVLFVFAIPLALVAAIVVLASPGPALFRQTRIGKNGVPFSLYKFRTLPIDEPQTPITITRGARTTRIGIFLRTTKLDELPQLINILKGEMSLVGPRPEIPDYVAIYPAADREVVLSVRPGLTDFASIRFRRESDLLAAQADPLDYYKRVLIPAKLRYARFYVAHATPLLDLYIMMLTAKYLCQDLAEAVVRRFKASARAE